MKLQVLIVFYICLVQICFGAVKREITNEMKNEMRKNAHNYLGDISERFIDDVLTIFDKFEDHRFVTKLISKSLSRQLDRIQRSENVSKIDVNSMKNYKSKNFNELDVEAEAFYIDSLKTFQTIFSKRLPAEITNGMMNLLYTIFLANATTENMENAVNYLYANETIVVKNPLNDIPEATARDCPNSMQRYSAVQVRLKSMTDIKPSVLQDVATIIEKFPCFIRYVAIFLEDFVHIIDVLQRFAKWDKKPINACLIKENLRSFERLDYHIMHDGTSYSGRISRDEIEVEMKTIDLILSTRLSDASFRGIINFQKAVIVESTPIDEIQKALEYVFIDVPMPISNCSTEH